MLGNEVKEKYAGERKRSPLHFVVKLQQGSAWELGISSTRGSPRCLGSILCHPCGKPLISGQAANLHSLFLTSKLHLQPSVTPAPRKTREGVVPTESWAAEAESLCRQGENRSREHDKSSSIPPRALWASCLREPCLHPMQIYQVKENVCCHPVFTTSHPLGAELDEE